MADVVDEATRSRMMSGIRGKDTKPEMIIRRGLHCRNYRYRLHDRRLPGNPDLVFRSRRAVIFVHGCFWHGHDCPLFRWPSTRADWWRDKIGANRMRDQKVRQELIAAGWRQARIWECALKGRGRQEPGRVIDRLAAWLDGDEGELDLRGRQ